MTTLANIPRKGQLVGTNDLLPREKLFCSFYLQSLNGADAAKRSGYVGNVYAHASRLLREPRIRTVIDEGYRALAPSPNEILIRLTARARASIADVFDIDESGHPQLNLKKAQEAGKLDLIRKIEYDSNGLPRVEMCDVDAALLHLAKILGMMADHHIITGADGGPVQVQAVRDSVALLLTNPDTMTQAMDLAEKLTGNKTENLTIEATSKPVENGG